MRTLLLSILATGLLAGSTVSGFAQEPPPDAQPDPGLEAMGKLADMVGRWEGTGWMRRGPGDPHYTRSTETVEPRLDGRVLVVEGKHWSQEDPTRMVHHALGVISYDVDAGHYRFRTWLANGREGDHEMRLEEDAIVWFIDSPRGTIRYTIRIHDGEWHETGETSADGETWQEFFGMDLKAVAER